MQDYNFCLHRTLQHHPVGVREGPDCRRRPKPALWPARPGSEGALSENVKSHQSDSLCRRRASRPTSGRLFRLPSCATCKNLNWPTTSSRFGAFPAYMPNSDSSARTRANGARLCNSCPQNSTPSRRVCSPNTCQCPTIPLLLLPTLSQGDGRREQLAALDVTQCRAACAPDGDAGADPSLQRRPGVLHALCN